MITRSLLYASEYPINEKITIAIPKVGQIVDNESLYYGAVSMITGMPIDFMVQLDDVGIDFTTINEYELFLIFFKMLAESDTSLIFGDLDLKKFEFAENTSTNMIVLIDRENDIVIDRSIHNLIANALRTIHHIERDTRTPGNEEAKKYMIERARKKQQRKKTQVVDSQLESLIISMVNTEQFKYDYAGTRELSIYQFNESVRQIIKKVEYDNRMIGVYTGNVNAKELSQDDLNWLMHK